MLVELKDYVKQMKQKENELENKINKIITEINTKYGEKIKECIEAYEICKENNIKCGGVLCIDALSKPNHSFITPNYNGITFKEFESNTMVYGIYGISVSAFKKPNNNSKLAPQFTTPYLTLDIRPTLDDDNVHHIRYFFNKDTKDIQTLKNQLEMLEDFYNCFEDFYQCIEQEIQDVISIDEEEIEI